MPNKPTRRRSDVSVLGLSLPLLLLSGLTLSAQEVITFLSFTNVWAYEQSGREPEPGWQTPSFDDQVWPRGPGLLGFEDVLASYLQHAPLQTRLTVLPAVTSFYFRTTFEFTGDLNGLILVATNLVDDGCVIYLNGEEVRRIRVPHGQTAATLATSGPMSEGTLESGAITNLSLLRPGRNVIAAEVHQSAPTSGDIMWGMKLMSIRSLPLIITREPQDLMLEEGQAGQLTAEISGGAAFFQWYRNDQAILNATNAVIAFAAATPSQSGRYFLMVSNSVSVVRSRTVSLIVYEDHAGPRMLSAATVAVAPPSMTNTVEITFSEPLLPVPGTTEITNYTLTRLAGGADISLIRALMSGSIVRLLVDTTDPDWMLGAACYVTVNHVRDWHSNVIAPSSRISVGWTETHLIQPSDALWSYHAAAIFDPQVYDEPWAQPGYTQGPWWAEGRAGFRGLMGTLLPCLGSPLTPIAFQPQPILFRSPFMWSGELPNHGQLHIGSRAIDGLVLYLNGAEIWRNNVPPGPIGPLSRAPIPSASVCITNTVLRTTNLVAGTNWLAAALVASAVSPSDVDSAFEFQMSVSASRQPAALPDEPPPTLEIITLDPEVVRLSWDGTGYALESATEFGANIASAPFGPWRDVPEMANPYLYRVTNSPGGTRFFRLKR